MSLNPIYKGYTRKKEFMVEEKKNETKIKKNMKHMI